MNEFKVYTRADLDTLINRRQGETKLGETVHTFEQNNWEETLRSSPASFVIVGIPEDIGVRANHGTGGAHTVFEPALKALLNVQETELLQGNKIAVLGSFDFSDLMQRSEKADVHELRELVSAMDDRVYPVIKAIADAGKLPVIIGGGHNNAYPILKGISRSKAQAVHCINLDAHSDYRAIEGRHSGNGFRYAKMDGYLKRYAVVGLHRNYNSQHVINEIISDPEIHLCFYEDIFLEEKNDFKSAVDEAIRFTAGAPAGIEIDLDCIERTLSSAATPCGLSTLQARQFLLQTVQFADIAYLHITEGSVLLSDGRSDMMTPKLVAYLITDFIRACTNKPVIFIRETEM